MLSSSRRRSNCDACYNDDYEEQNDAGAQAGRLYLWRWRRKNVFVMIDNKIICGVFLAAIVMDDNRKNERMMDGDDGCRPLKGRIWCGPPHCSVGL